jgi:uncharacterized protein (TIGR03086 family)
MSPQTGPNPLILLDRALDQCATIISGIGANQAHLPTPCHDWDVATLLHHLVVQDLHNFTVAARGENVDWQASHTVVGADWSHRFRDSAAVLKRTWAAADLNRLIALPGGGEAPLRSRASQQIAEFTVHAWDLSQATGQHIVLDTSLAEHSLLWSQRMLRPEFRGRDKTFGIEVPVPEDAPVYDRLVGWFGRDPQWARARA